MKNSSLEQEDNRTKIAFLVRPGMDKFVDSIANNLSPEYIAKIAFINYHYNRTQIDQWMKWADIVWFDRCGEIADYASKCKLASKTKLVCKFGQKDLFSSYPQSISWSNIDRLIFSNKQTKNLFEANFSNLINGIEIDLVNNCLDLTKIKFSKKDKGYKIGYMGFIRANQNSELLLQIISKLVDINPKYELHIAGQFEDDALKLHWQHQVEEMELKDNIFFLEHDEHLEKLDRNLKVYYDGWDNNIDDWFEDKSYIILTSNTENFGYSIAEGMSRGLKPIIYDFYSAELIWDEDYLFNTIDEAVNMITSNEFDSKQYRDFIEKNYSVNKNLDSIKAIIDDLREDYTFSNQINNFSDLKKINEPDFLIAGVSKAGTTSLYNYIEQFGANFVSPFCKEIHFFTENYYKGMEWYRKLFSPKLSTLDITGEATPSYLYFPFAPKRVYENLPNIKFVVLLRNPIDRAYSQYNYQKNNRNKRAPKIQLPFEEAIAKEEERLEKDLAKVKDGKMTPAYKYHSYLTHGLYYKHLKRWFEYFSRDQFLIIESKEFFSNTKSVLDKVFDFLDLEYKPDCEFDFRKYNKNKYNKINRKTRSSLNKFFKPYNEKLYDLLDRDFDWD